MAVRDTAQAMGSASASASMVAPAPTITELTSACTRPGSVRTAR
jgi:hypothetical protein